MSNEEPYKFPIRIINGPKTTISHDQYGSGDVTLEIEGFPCFFTFPVYGLFEVLEHSSIEDFVRRLVDAFNRLESPE